MTACLKNKLSESIEHWKSLWVDPYKDKKQEEDAANQDILLDEVISRLGFGKFQIKLLFIDFICFFFLFSLIGFET